jgi:hypothetical protein
MLNVLRTMVGPGLVMLNNLNNLAVLHNDVGESVKMPGINYSAAGNSNLHCLIDPAYAIGLEFTLTLF